jgi:7,8-dihydroneopterin aldolase/epimerase/oxygenase
MLPLMDRIQISGLRSFGHHGVFDEERRQGQPFVIDVSVEVDLSAAAGSDALADTIDYGSLAERLAGAVANTQFRLIEALAGHLADLVLSEPLVAAVEVRVAKPRAPIAVQVDEVAVLLRRERREDR